MHANDSLRNKWNTSLSVLTCLVDFDDFLSQKSDVASEQIEIVDGEQIFEDVCLNAVSYQISEIYSIGGLLTRKHQQHL